MGGLAGLLVFVLLAFTAVSGPTQAAGTSSTAPTGGPVLNPAKVPAAYLAQVEAAGALCAGVPAPAIAAQLDQESGWNPNAVSGAGAEGIAQFMPGTWATWGRDYDSSGTSTPFDPGDAIPSQGHLMCSLYGQTSALVKDGRVSGDPLQLAWAAYNAGLGAVIAAGGIPPIAQTQTYVADLVTLMARYTLSVAGSGSGRAIVAAALTQLGLPYVYGGGNANGPTGGGFDCSGFTLFSVARGTGGRVVLPHSAAADRTTPLLVTVPGAGPNNLAVMQPGDVVVFNIPSDPAPWGHVGIYAGNGILIHAPQPGGHVEQIPISDFNNVAWTVRRVVGTTSTSTTTPTSPTSTASGRTGR